jgi:hypothetical protein
LDLVQGKTKKAVSIPIMKEEVIDILKNYNFYDQLNYYMPIQQKLTLYM